MVVIETGIVKGSINTTNKSDCIRRNYDGQVYAWPIFVDKYYVHIPSLVVKK